MDVAVPSDEDQLRETPLGILVAWIRFWFAMAVTATGVLVFSLYFGYFFLCEASFSTTPGKYWYGLCVRKLDGSKCGVVGAFLRTITRFVEVNPIMLGALPAVISIHITERKQRLGDLLAGTVVVDRRSVK